MSTDAAADRAHGRALAVFGVLIALLAAVVVALYGVRLLDSDQRSMVRAVSLGAGTYDSVSALLTDLEVHGLGCGTATTVTQPTNGATSMADCGDTVVVAIYPTHPAAEHAFDIVTGLLDAGQAHMAIGGNWTLLGDDPAYTQRVATALHAEYHTA